jgi:hypothetical protein
MRSYYTATERYDRTAEGWNDHFEWRGLPQLVELVSMENVPAFHERDFTPEDWRHVAPTEEVGCPASWSGVLCFRRLGPLVDCILRLGGDKPINLLWVCRGPIEQPLPPASQLSFEFLGCDLIDGMGLSPLTNCGRAPFPEAFSDAEISELGLIRTLERAKRIQADLRRDKGPHANCSLWAIFRSMEVSHTAQLLDKFVR